MVVVGHISKDSATFFIFRCDLKYQARLDTLSLIQYVFDVLIFCSRVAGDTLGSEGETHFLNDHFKVKLIIRNHLWF